jgi:hypothetical protein
MTEGSYERDKVSLYLTDFDIQQAFYRIPNGILSLYAILYIFLAPLSETIYIYENMIILDMPRYI